MHLMFKMVVMAMTAVMAMLSVIPFISIMILMATGYNDSDDQKS